MWDIQLKTFFGILYVRFTEKGTQDYRADTNYNPVGTYLSNYLRLRDLLYQTLNPASIPSHLRTYQTRQHVHLCWGTSQYLE